MFELMVSTVFEKQDYISDLFKKLGSEIKKDGGIAAMQNHSGRSSFALAVPSRKKEYYKSKILEHIIFMIIDDYKFNYFKESIAVYDNEVIFESFLKAISIFDAEADKEYIKNQIELKGEILVDSFYFFKLMPLRSKWKRTADIINQNQILKSKSSMLEVLKYLTAMSENFSMETNIVLSKKQIKLTSLSKCKRFKRNFSGISLFMTEMIKLNPVKINLKQDAEEKFDSDEVADMLSKIFDDKIYLTN